jgi:hypothetical protein
LKKLLSVLAVTVTVLSYRNGPARHAPRATFTFNSEQEALEYSKHIGPLKRQSARTCTRTYDVLPARMPACLDGKPIDLTRIQ